MRANELAARKRKSSGIGTLVVFGGALLGVTACFARGQSSAQSEANVSAATTKSAEGRAAAPRAAGQNALEATRLALCPVVYPDDQTPARRGYRYTFFGNAFFINDQGYLLTVAHVLESFREGGQPYILVNRRNAPPELVKVAIAAKDPQHDVAILRATPNPFAGGHEVAFVPLSAEPPVLGESVLALSLHPKSVQNAHSFEYQHEDSSPGTVLALESTQLQKLGPPAEVFLLSHPVVKGQSGSPVLALDSRGAVGLIEGLWLRGVTLSSAKASALPADTPGAAVPIRYAMALLDENHVSWTSAPEPPTVHATPHSQP